MMKFSIGYNHDIKLLDELGAYRDNIEALYFPMPKRYLSSGRHIPQKDGYPSEVPRLIKKCTSLSIKPQLLLNATCEGKKGLEKTFFSKIINYIEKLKDVGLRSVIVTNPLYISEIKRQIKGIEIESSVNCYVKTVEHALYLKDLGADVLTVDRDINRNIPLIREIKIKTGLRIRIMLNEGCLRNCPFRHMHYNYLAHGAGKPDRLVTKTSPDTFCIGIYLKNPSKFFSIPFIPPDAVKYYTRVADYYKLSTRVFSTPRIKSCLAAYVNKDFRGNLLEILDSPGLSFFSFIDYGVLKKNNFFVKMAACKNNCGDCGYCGRLTEKAVIPNPDFMNGKKKSEFNKYKKAVKNAQETIESMPREISGYISLGSFYSRIKKNYKALEIYKKALTNFPDNPGLHRDLAITYYRLRRYGSALQEARLARKLGYRESDIYLLSGFCYKKNKEYKKAIREFKKAEKLSPQAAQINFSLLASYRNAGRMKEADEELEKGILKVKRNLPIGGG